MRCLKVGIKAVRKSKYGWQKDELPRFGASHPYKIAYDCAKQSADNFASELAGKKFGDARVSNVNSGVPSQFEFGTLVRIRNVFVFGTLVRTFLYLERFSHP
jgi:hypothetical protein